MPRFEVKDPAPELETVIANWRMSDYALVLGATAASYLYGYVGKQPSVMRLPTAQTCAILGNFGAILFIYQRTSFRLMGEIE
ncbi:hypothetical protein CTAYLR_003993 [Chrysophaeum taylorii]|uniref:NADH-ubiquinone oxidoreductase 21kDa subunit N-terminal domain-containing protein n=1 Tax=Chrysophaeum taylorii TaxID=2483200 RepID=A0AAD7XIV9_9STRA|nr:hypothetical protein CTAYLR_003993 [Chrysophaeum taylorii]